MKILMISNHLGVQSGVQRYVQNLLLNLDLTRYQVDLFVGLCPPDQASCAPALEAAGVHIIAVPDNKKARIRVLYQHLKTHKDYDIIHYHTASKIGAPVCGMMRVLCPHAKIIVHSHIVYPPMTLTWRAAHLVYQLFADYFLGCGVPCLASTNVPGDGSVTELVHFLPLSAPFEEWAKTADSIAPGGPHADYWPTLAAAGYELKTAAHRMEQMYDKVAGEGAR